MELHGNGPHGRQAPAPSVRHQAPPFNIQGQQGKRATGHYTHTGSNLSHERLKDATFTANEEITVPVCYLWHGPGSRPSARAIGDWRAGEALFLAAHQLLLVHQPQRGTIAEVASALSLAVPASSWSWWTATTSYSGRRRLSADADTLIADKSPTYSG